ncbi:hypothetical protein I350_06072 [Cryptococcus amylolentus CBS 6273]|uniref:Uncharacterized protein n=1 Tax=Cryptococcus amylolentus CBS 6273 TaxID=1296118 RepID=A0A1E3JT07_9TREE|nr:hypothetical protein I350_06072 [Cryptococcus amylolentus CBS 6273]
MAASTNSRNYPPLPFVPQSSLSEPKPAHSTDSALQLSITHHPTWLLVSGILVIARAKEVKAHFIQKELHSGSDARKAAEKAATGVVVSLGLVEGEEGK